MTARTRQLTDNVWRIRLDSECGLVVNVFAVRSGHQLALIDTGFPHTVEQLGQGLREIGAELGDVTDVLYTHTHIDHMGGGAALGHAWGPREWVWSGTDPAFGNYYDYYDAIRSTPEWPIGFLEPGRAAHPLVSEIHAKPRTPLRAGGDGRLSDPRGVDFGESVRIGDLEFRCVDGRGHDRYHCAWYEPSLRWLFSGDVVLAVPVPLVAGMGDEPVRWLRTLSNWERDLDVAWLLPGHGMPTRLFGPSIARSRSSLERLYGELRRQLAGGSLVDPMAVMRGVLPSDPSRYAARSAVLLANVETLLCSLEQRGIVAREEAHRWRMRTAVPALDALVPRA